MKGIHALLKTLDVEGTLTNNVRDSDGSSRVGRDEGQNGRGGLEASEYRDRGDVFLLRRWRLIYDGLGKRYQIRPLVWAEVELGLDHACNAKYLKAETLYWTIAPWAGGQRKKFWGVRRPLVTSRTVSF